MRVRDVMTYGAIGVPATATLAEAVETLLRSHVSALLVFDADNALVGILSEGDLLRRSELGTEKKRPHWLEFLLSGGALAESYAQAHGRKVRDIMTRAVETIGEDADLAEAVDRMLSHKV
jgi:CBS domain-containing protein